MATKHLRVTLDAAPNADGRANSAPGVRWVITGDTARAFVHRLRPMSTLGRRDSRRRPLFRGGGAVALLLSLAVPGRADFSPNLVPADSRWLVVSPQVGGGPESHDGPVFGTTASYYWMLRMGGPGIGVGASGYGEPFQVEALAKLSILGLAGGGLGWAFQSGEAGFAGDAWVSAVFLGVRYRFVRIAGDTRQTWMVFAPLWYLGRR